jgi:hypothetical protein
VKQRAEYTVARHEDIEILRQSLDVGSEWTKDQAKISLGWNERRFRATVAALREEGYPVISSSEKGSTYRKAWSEHELEEFIRRELSPRIRHLDYQISALRAAAPRHFAPPEPAQLELIG